MSVDVSSLTNERALSVAYKSEIEAEETYKKLKKQVKNFVLKDKLQFLINEEKKHQKLLEAMYKKMFNGKEISPAEKSLVPRLDLALSEETLVPDLLEMAVELEKVSEEFYDTLSEEIEDRGVQEILQYLASMEHGHYFLLKGELELCQRDEMYYDRDDFQYDMIHVGP
jgi:rubrerythrin